MAYPVNISKYQNLSVLHREVLYIRKIGNENCKNVLYKKCEIFCRISRIDNNNPCNI